MERLEKDKTEGRQTDGLVGEGWEERWGEAHGAGCWTPQVCFYRWGNMSPGRGTWVPVGCPLSGLEPRGTGCQKQSLWFPVPERSWLSKQW